MSLDVLPFCSLILGDPVDTALLEREPATDDDERDDEFSVLLASTSDMLLGSEYRYRFI